MRGENEKKIIYKRTIYILIRWSEKYVHEYLGILLVVITQSSMPIGGRTKGSFFRFMLHAEY